MSRRSDIPPEPGTDKPPRSVSDAPAPDDGIVTEGMRARPLPGDGGIAADAGEFVLGTLELEERERFERLTQADPEARDLANFWRTRLAPLDEVAAAVSPSPAVWEAIESALPHGAIVAANDDTARAMRRSRNRWRGAAIAAALLLAAGAFVLLDPTLRGQIERRFGLPSAAPVVASAGTETYIAVVNSEGKLPAMVIRVDAASGRISVRRLALPQPEGRSLQLWHIPQGSSDARSVGLLDDGAAVDEIAARPGDTFAVTEEAPGGSPSGQATGPIILSGQLIREPD